MFAQKENLHQSILLDTSALLNPSNFYKLVIENFNGNDRKLSSSIAVMNYYSIWNSLIFMQLKT